MAFSRTLGILSGKISPRREGFFFLCLSIIFCFQSASDFSPLCSLPTRRSSDLNQTWDLYSWSRGLFPEPWEFSKAKSLRGKKDFGLGDGRKQFTLKQHIPSAAPTIHGVLPFKSDLEPLFLVPGPDGFFPNLGNSLRQNLSSSRRIFFFVFVDNILLSISKRLQSSLLSPYSSLFRSKSDL